MEYKVLIASDMVLAGQLDFKLSDLLNAFAMSNNSLVDMRMIGHNKEEIASELENPQYNLVIFSENKNLDEVIIDNINYLSSDKVMIDELAVVFKKENKQIIFLPIDLDWKTLLSKTFDLSKDDEFKYCKFHLFGKSAQTVMEELSSLKAENNSLKYNVIGSHLLADIYASYKGEENLIDSVQMKIASLFRDNIYSENDLGLCQIVFELLRIRGLKIAIMEDVTGGKIISSLCSTNASFSQVLALAKVGMKQELEPEAIYNEAFNLLRDSQSDVVMVSSGTLDDKGLNLLLAIGDKKSIHVYKNRFNADKADCLDMATNCALFHLVKKLRQNDFAF